LRLLKKQNIIFTQRRKGETQFNNRLLRSYLPADINGGATWRETIIQMIQVKVKEETGCVKDEIQEDKSLEISMKEI